MTARSQIGQYLLPLLFIICFLPGSKGQNYVFKVLANKGSNQFRSAVNEEWKAIKFGIAFQRSDELKLMPDSYLGLIHSSGRTLEFRKSGIFKVVDLEKGSGMKRGLPTKYSEFVSNKIFSIEETDGTKTRGEDEIHLFLPRISEVFNEEFIITWKDPDGHEDASYTVEVKNMFNETIDTVETDEPNVIINFNDPSIAKERFVVIRVYVNEAPEIHSPVYSIRKVNSDNRIQLEEELNTLEPVFDKNSPLDHIVMAIIFEEKDLLVDALYHYHKAMEFAPDVEDIQKVYSAFLDRNGME